MRSNIDDSLSSINQLPVLKILDFSLRLAVIPLATTTIYITVTNQQNNSSYGKLEFSNIMGLKYMVCISAICAGYALIAAISSWVRCLVSKAWLFFVSDQIVTYLMVTSGAAALEILYLVYNGDREVSWSETCSSYGKVLQQIEAGIDSPYVHSFLLYYFSCDFSL
ncbi:CASP-like protein [Quillaja saponaria]|uniref:CASP-like protein n=1 Tax=Quillaja saponaria TaxID=32244 RepID=A0AAD7LMS9_QUISA|nr:CASP-like protein [Quillaja saponaria]